MGLCPKPHAEALPPRPLRRTGPAGPERKRYGLEFPRRNEGASGTHTGGPPKPPHRGGLTMKERQSPGRRVSGAHTEITGAQHNARGNVYTRGTRTRPPVPNQAHPEEPGGRALSTSQKEGPADATSSILPPLDSANQAKQGRTGGPKPKRYAPGFASPEKVPKAQALRAWLCDFPAGATGPRAGSSPARVPVSRPA